MDDSTALLTHASHFSAQLKAIASGSISAPSERETRLQVIAMRQLNRRLYSIINEQRRRLSELKSGIDELNAKLASCRFEKQHLFAAAQKCLNTPTIYDSIPLEGTGDAHEVVITRLHAELAQRRELQSRLQAILQRKQETEVALQAKLKKFEELKHQIQQLMKASKPLIETSNFNATAMEQVTSDSKASPSSSASTSITLTGMFEKLATFVAERENCKLRMIDGREEDYEGMEESTADLHRLSPHIHLRILDLEVDCYITVDESGSLQFTCEHECLPSTAISESFLRDLPLERLSTGQMEWLQDGEDLESVFDVITGRIRSRLAICTLLQSTIPPPGLRVTLNASEASIISVLKGGGEESLLLGKIDSEYGSVHWTSQNGEFPALEEINAVSLKFRSAVDCLQAQLQLIFENINP